MSGPCDACGDSVHTRSIRLATDEAKNLSVCPFVRPSQEAQWWLAELDQYDNVNRLIDGSHCEARGAHHAFYLLGRLRLLKAEVKYAVVKCEVFAPVGDATGANEEMLNVVNAIMP